MFRGQKQTDSRTRGTYTEARRQKIRANYMQYPHRQSKHKLQKYGIERSRSLIRGTQVSNNRE